MNSLFIWMQIRDKERIKFSNSVIEWIKAGFQDILVFDFDNHSEPFLTDKAVDLVTQADRIVLMVEAEEGKDAGGVMRFLNRLSRIANKQLLILSDGNHDLVLKMLKILSKGNLLKDINDDLKKIKIKDFLNGR